MTLERRRVVLRVGGEQEKQGKKMDEEPEGFHMLKKQREMHSRSVTAYMETLPLLVKSC